MVIVQFFHLNGGSKRTAFFILLLSVSIFGKSQKNSNLYIISDRDIYASGENVWLKAFSAKEELSGLVHFDLISNNGDRISGINTKILEGQSEGVLYLPDSIASGSYLLRASTRTGSKLVFKEIYVTNRFSDPSQLERDLRPVESTPLAEVNVQKLAIEGLEEKYTMRTHGQVSIKLPLELLSQLDGNLLVGIAFATPDYNARTFVMETDPGVVQRPEREGIILEGRVVGTESNEPQEGAMVYLSIPDSIPGFMYDVTDNAGRFYFELRDYYGKVDAVLQCFDMQDSMSIKIQLPEPEVAGNVFPTMEWWPFPETFHSRIDLISEVVTYRKLFDQKEYTIPFATEIMKQIHPFYPVPTQSIDVKQFIDLADFNEIARELLSGVRYRISDGIPSVRIYSPHSYNYFSEPPLILLDGIPVRDLSIIKEMGTKEIDRVELCQDERFFGDLRFQGVMALYSTNSLDGWFHDSNDLIRLELDAMQLRPIPKEPPEQSDTEPDLRQLLLWSPEVKPGQTIKFDFLTSDIQGSYRLFVYGKASDQIFYSERFFKVE